MQLWERTESVLFSKPFSKRIPIVLTAKADGQEQGCGLKFKFLELILRHLNVQCMSFTIPGGNPTEQK